MRLLPTRFIRSTTAPAWLSAPVCALALGACASSDAPPPREPLKLDVAIRASSTVNPDDQKRAAPILVRVYELKSLDAFNEADFQSLQDKDKTVLAADLVARDQFMLRPGESRRIARNAQGATTALGVIAAYRDLPHAVWRATTLLPATPTAAWYRRAPKLRLAIDLDTDAIRISDAQSPSVDPSSAPSGNRPHNE
ncbi:type VI secretion system lipoprotein TssJ [Caballeronia sp. LZ034LL]|uniref:type VI secretion system lipoprotein TssJ n=1 Tax=Caballeronia sp. LZ034LL TaxID=3038567 RepID=UPI00285A44B5|nr:type VI secretion system lipoprotein TssJ [Caballeronia sp. LZ034LL]MDR5836974.1 type VI secretion system lipoprotein TssJ [Caballeronia sp. LZ034LL]